MLHSEKRRGSRFQGDGGAVVVEAAMVFPIILLVLAGTIDAGIGFKERTTIQGAVRNGARVGAAALDAPNADALALSTFYAGISGVTHVTFNKVIIYEANSNADGKPSANCLAVAVPPAAGPPGSGTGRSSGTDQCNVYNYTQVVAAAVPSPNFGTGTANNCSSGWDRFWCAGGSDAANERVANLSVYGNVDSFGMYVQYTYTPFTKIVYPNGIVIDDFAVMRLEPRPGS